MTMKFLVWSADAKAMGFSLAVASGWEPLLRYC